MDQLATELQIKILGFLHELSQSGSSSERDLPPSCLFPFNAASVCTRWLAILSQIPGCWTRIVFDIAEDPTPFIDAFLWSKDLPKIEVLVFTSSRESKKRYEKIERRRTFAVAQALRPHILRCKSIVFDMVYSTSLPPAHIFFVEDAPDLEELSLQCRVDNFKIVPHSWATAVKAHRQLATDFHCLRKLSLTGFSFMYLAMTSESPSVWFGALRLFHSAQVHITRFTFLESGHYSMANFMLYISRLVLKGSRSLDLSDLNISDALGNPLASAGSLKTRIFARRIHFKSVSKDFIAFFYIAAKAFSPYSVTFQDCQIPTTIGRDYFLYCGKHLVLNGVVDDDCSSGIQHILDMWGNLEARLDIRACKSFNDSVISRLQSRQPYDRYPMQYLHFLNIRDCANFSPGALRELIMTRNAQPLTDFLYRQDPRVRELSVTGRGPKLSKEDKDWFVAQTRTAVRWVTEDEDGITWEEFHHLSLEVLNT